MNRELIALAKNKTCEIVNFPKGKKAIGGKWVYKIKLKSNGSLGRFNTRPVAKGFDQQHDIDYETTFSPVV